LWNLRQIIFVCHSMGGIAVRRFICVNQAKFIERKMDLGLFLVASPSLGSKDANALYIFARLLRNTQAEALRFCQTNTWLNDLDKEFLTLKEDKKVSISGKELVEDEAIKIKKYLGFHTQIVEPYSAARYFGEPYKVPHSNHNTIAKPEDDEAIQHKLLVLFIRKMMYEPKDNWPAGPIAPEGREEATKALLALNERLSAGKIEDKSALAAFSLAIIETRRYL